MSTEMGSMEKSKAVVQRRAVRAVRTVRTGVGRQGTAHHELRDVNQLRIWSEVCVASAIAIVWLTAPKQQFVRFAIHSHIHCLRRHSIANRYYECIAKCNAIYSVWWINTMNAKLSTSASLYDLVAFIWFDCHSKYLILMTRLTAYRCRGVWVGSQSKPISRSFVTSLFDLIFIRFTDSENKFNDIS